MYTSRNPDRNKIGTSRERPIIDAFNTLRYHDRFQFGTTFGKNGFYEGNEDLNEEFEKINTQIIDLNNVRDEINDNISKCSENLTGLEKKSKELLVEYQRDKSRLESLKNITERYEGYGNSIRKIMEIKDNKKGVIGVVADIIKVDKEYEIAIETALGGSIQNVVTDTENTAKELIEYLKKNKRN